MRNVDLRSSSPEMEAVYGKFDLTLEGVPTEQWENRNLKKLRLPEMLQHLFFPQVYLVKVWVNRRMMGAIERVYIELSTRWDAKARADYGLNQFVKCYAFGDGDRPSLFWYGGAWELSPAVSGEVLEEAIGIFKKYGFKHDRKRLRVFEYW